LGRLQRKRGSSSKKKKKKNVNSGETSQAKNVTAGTKAEILAGSVRDTKKRRAPSLTKHSSATKAAPRKLKSNYLDKALQFLREVKVELKKVTWPTRKQTIGSTVVVIILVMIISLFLGIVDIGLSNLFHRVLQ